MVIKNHSNKNRYYLTNSGLWVRDFTRVAHPQDINNLIPPSDYDIILSNEMKNATMRLASIDAETIYAPNIIIVSDGYKFEEKQHILKKIPPKVKVIGVNRSLVKWGAGRMDWFVANNPYKECLSFLPSNNYYPRCIVSTRTNPDFIARYRARLGVLYRYQPVNDENFSSNYFQRSLYYVDDYRNAICAAIGLAYRWGVQKLMLFCCDDVFSGERPGAVSLPNGLWMYPQHNVSHDLIEGNLYWLVNQEFMNIKVVNYSSGPECKYAPYIKEEEVLDFFK